jgi:hypothetical protein
MRPPPAFAVRGVGLPAALPPLAVAGVAAAGCFVVGLNDPTRAAFFPPCPFRVLTGLDCPGCGSTRAVHHLLSGDVAAAAGFNVLMVLAVPYLLYSWTVWALTALGWPRPPALRWRAGPVWAVVVLIVGFWALRNLPVTPFDGLGTD